MRNNAQRPYREDDLLSGTSALFTAPDPAILQAGAAGERLVANTRLVFFLTVWTVPAGLGITRLIDLPELWVSLVASTITIVISALLVLAIRRGWRFPGLAFATTAFDITIVSATLATFALVGRPHVAANSLVVWEIYLLAILATTLRFDARVCLFAGALAIIEYGAVLSWVASRWDLNSPDPLAIYGAVSWPVQGARFLLMAIAAALAIGIVNASRRLMHVSGTDRLTGLPNRMYFDERIQIELSRANRLGHRLTIAFLDIDNFKHFNDHFGHNTGDAALQTVASVLRNQSREEDFVARWGGEEFAMIFPDTNVRDAERHVDRVRNRLMTTPIRTSRGDTLLTVSGGLVEFPSDGRDAESLIAVADRRLLEAKRSGRDRVLADA